MFIYGLFATIIGAVLFALLNSIFNVYYFGCFGICATFLGCVVAGMFIIPFILYILASSFKWIAIVVVGLIILNVLAKLCK